MARNPGDTRPTRCVYTTLVGGYETLNEQHCAAHSDIAFICLTDDRSLKSETWTIRHVDPVFGMDPIRSQRDLKIRPGLHLPEFDQTLYIDNTVILADRPEAIFETYLSEGPIALPVHSYRDRVLDEFMEVSRLGLDDQGRIFEQLNHYLVDHAAALDERPFWTAILLRDSRDKRVRAMQEFWLAHVNRYSRRDQLSINIALRAAGLEPHPITIDNYNSWFHSWPAIHDRDRNRGPRTSAVSFQPQAARIRALELTISEREQAADEVGRAYELDLKVQRQRYEHELDAQSQRQRRVEDENQALYRSLAEQQARSDGVLSETCARYEAALSRERARFDALVASPGGRIAGALSRLAHRFPNAAKLAWRASLILWWIFTLQLFARLRKKPTLPSP